MSSRIRSKGTYKHKMMKGNYLFKENLDGIILLKKNLKCLKQYAWASYSYKKISKALKDLESTT